eukprot:evm.model.NODE_13589_length_1081_cov_8.448659.1
MPLSQPKALCVEHGKLEFLLQLFFGGVEGKEEVVEAPEEQKEGRKEGRREER